MANNFMSSDGHTNLGAVLEDDSVNKNNFPRTSTENANTQSKKSSGCCQSFKKGMAYIWSTRQTLDLTGNEDLHIKTTFRELIIYCVFLAILCIMTFGMTSSTTYTFTNVLSTLLIQTPGDSANPGSNFLGMNLPGDFFDYVEKVLFISLYKNWESWYNGETTGVEEGLGFVYYENMLQGVPRIRQVRVKSNSCQIPDDFQSQIKACYASYSQITVDKLPFGIKNGSAWTYKSEDELKGSGITAEVNSYDGGGFYVDLNTTAAYSQVIVDDLKKNLWIDRGTRAVFIDFTVYNANINLFCAVKLIAEFPPTGGIIPSYVFRPAKLIRYNSPGDFFVLVCEVIFCFFVIYYIIEEILEIKKLGVAYLKEFWNILDIVVLLIAICCIAFDVYCYFEVKKLLNTLFAKPDVYVDFDFITYWQTIFNSAVAVMVFFAWIKIFKYISFNKMMTQLSSTLGASSKDLSGFSVMFFIIFLAFAQLGYLMFGTQAADFNTFSNSIFTLFRIILGDFNFQALQQANRVLGPVYFILYVFFVFFILLNMFLAIINDTYSEVKAELANQPNEIDVSKYFKEKANNVLQKLNLKKQKIIEIQTALKTADADGDKAIDFDEWRNDLKTRGYADKEIEAVFAKYDKNGDRLLDENELLKMQADLEGQKAEISENLTGLDKQKMLNKEEGYHSDDEGNLDATGEEFTLLKRRVDRMENSIGNIVSKISTVLVKLEAMESAKAKRRETIVKLIDNLVESGDVNDETVHQQIERSVKEEVERWEKESFVPKDNHLGS